MTSEIKDFESRLRDEHERRSRLSHRRNYPGFLKLARDIFDLDDDWPESHSRDSILLGNRAHLRKELRLIEKDPQELETLSQALEIVILNSQINLDGREKTAIYLRYGLNNPDGGMTFRKLGNKLPSMWKGYQGLSTDRARVVVKTALRKMTRWSIENPIYGLSYKSESTPKTKRVIFPGL